MPLLGPEVLWLKVETHVTSEFNLSGTAFEKPRPMIGTTVVLTMWPHGVVQEPPVKESRSTRLFDLLR